MQFLAYWQLCQKISLSPFLSFSLFLTLGGEDVGGADVSQESWHGHAHAGHALHPELEARQQLLRRLAKLWKGRGGEVETGRLARYVRRFIFFSTCCRANADSIPRRAGLSDTFTGGSFSLPVMPPQLAQAELPDTFTGGSLSWPVVPPQLAQAELPDRFTGVLFLGLLPPHQL